LYIGLGRGATRQSRKRPNQGPENNAANDQGLVKSQNGNDGKGSGKDGGNDTDSDEDDEENE